MVCLARTHCVSIFGGETQAQVFFFKSLQAISRVIEVVRNRGEGQGQVWPASSFESAVSELMGGGAVPVTITGTVAPPTGLPSSGVLGILAVINTPRHTQTVPGAVFAPCMSETLLHADGGRVGLGRGGSFDRQHPALSSTLFLLMDLSGTGQRRKELQWQMQVKTWLCLLQVP